MSKDGVYILSGNLVLVYTCVVASGELLKTAVTRIPDLFRIFPVYHMNRNAPICMPL